MLASARSCALGVLGALLACGCVFDPHGARQDTTSTTGQGGTTSATSSGTGVTTSTTGATGGGGSGPVCGDGVVEPPETCETGTLSFPSCAGCTIVHTCGNGVIEPGEDCDDATAACSSCAPSPTSACYMAESLPLSLTPVMVTSSGASTTVPGSFGDGSPACASGSTRPVKIFRFDVGPYPEGLFVSATGAPGLDAVLWAYRGCSQAPVACNDVDPDPLGFATNTAFLALPIAPPGSVFYVGVADWGPGSGSFNFVAAPTRFFEDFKNGFGQFTPSAGLSASLEYVYASAPSAKVTLDSSDIDMVNVGTLQVGVQHNLSSSGMASVTLVPTGGGATAQATLNSTSGLVAGQVVNLAVPPGTQTAKLHFEMAAGSGYWEIHRVVAGPKP